MTTVGYGDRYPTTGTGRLAFAPSIDRLEKQSGRSCRLALPFQICCCSLLLGDGYLLDGPGGEGGGDCAHQGDADHQRGAGG